MPSSKETNWKTIPEYHKEKHQLRDSNSERSISTQLSGGQIRTIYMYIVEVCEVCLKPVHICDAAATRGRATLQSIKKNQKLIIVPSEKVHLSHTDWCGLLLCMTSVTRAYLGQSWASTSRQQ